MKLILFFPLFLLPCFAFAQTKPIRYFDENMSTISKKEYEQDRKNPNFLHLEFDLDTAKYYVKTTREHSGQMPAETLQLLKKDLEATSQTAIPAEQLIVIDYYPGPDPCNTSGTTDKSWIKADHAEYQKALHKSGPVFQCYIYSRKEGLERYEGIYAWYPDLHDRVRQLFFKMHYPCGSVVVIRPDGKYKSYYGEYASETVLAMIGALREH